MVSPPPCLDLYPEVRDLFAHPSGNSARKLAAVINKNIGAEFKGATASLDALLSAISKQLLLSSFGHRESIDDYVNLVMFTSLLINSGTVDAGIGVDEGGRTPRKPAVIHPISGPTILGRSLANALSEELEVATSRSRPPVEEWDRAKPIEYYYKAMIHATILARAFALTDLFRDALWITIEDILVKSLFSGDEPEPGIFVVLTSILLGAGKEIEVYMGEEEEKGRGRNWLWEDNVRVGCDERWGWRDVVEVLRRQHEWRMVNRLPEYVKGGLRLGKAHIGDGEIGDSWCSKRLVSEAFNWDNADLDRLGI